MPKHAGHPRTGFKRALASPRLIITFLAVALILLMVFPIAVGVGAYFAFGHFDLLNSTQRILVSTSIGLLSMLFLNMAVMIPLAGFTASLARRLEQELPPEEQALVTQLGAQHRDPSTTPEVPVSSGTPPHATGSIDSLVHARDIQDQIPQASDSNGFGDPSGATELSKSEPHDN